MLATDCYATHITVKFNTAFRDCLNFQEFVPVPKRRKRAIAEAGEMTELDATMADEDDEELEELIKSNEDDHPVNEPHGKSPQISTLTVDPPLVATHDPDKRDSPSAERAAPTPKPTD